MNPRHKKVLELRASGKTFREIAVEIGGVTRGRAFQIYTIAKSKQESIK